MTRPVMEHRTNPNPERPNPNPKLSLVSKASARRRHAFQGSSCARRGRVVAVMVVLSEPAARMRHAIRGKVVAVVVVLDHDEPAARMRHANPGSSRARHVRVVAIVVVLDEPAALMRHAIRGKVVAVVVSLMSPPAPPGCDTQTEAAAALVVAESWPSC